MVLATSVSSPARMTSRRSMGQTQSARMVKMLRRQFAELHFGPNAEYNLVPEPLEFAVHGLVAAAVWSGLSCMGCAL